MSAPSGAPGGLAQSDLLTREELQLAARNHGMPLEALRYPITPVGLHYLLVHYDIPAVDGERWRLMVEGRVRRSLTLSLADLQDLPVRTLAATMECAGNGRADLTPRPLSQPWLLEAVGTGEWTGAALGDVLERASLLADARELVFTGLDRGVEGGVEQRYERSLPLAEALRDEVLIAYRLNGAPLPPQHGFPARLVVPGWYGMTNVKWLSRITAVTEPFAGYQQVSGYRLRRDADDPGVPVTRMLPRALMVPPGIPEFMTRRRSLPLGRHRLEGRAWSGWAPIQSVAVSTDGGASWAAARLDGDATSQWAWRGWSWQWDPPAAGEYELLCRAQDAAGNAQPTAPAWNVGGYANNAPQRVAVTVTDPEPSPASG
ncbi:MAG TPA: sulfite oxidase [Candidatus Dormibacteraeota bacterium]